MVILKEEMSNLIKKQLKFCYFVFLIILILNLQPIFSKEKVDRFLIFFTTYYH